MTTKQKVTELCNTNKIEIDISIGVGRQVDLLAPTGYSFQSGLHCLCSPTYYTCQYEVWNNFLERLEDELPLIECNCEECRNEIVS